MEVSLNGAAFDDPLAGPAPELQRLLDSVTAALGEWPDLQTGRLVDVNGNQCGVWYIEEDELDG